MALEVAEHRGGESDDDDDDVGAKMSPLSPIVDQAKIVSKPRLFSPGVILGDSWVLFSTACHKAVFSLWVGLQGNVKHCFPEKNTVLTIPKASFTLPAHTIIFLFLLLSNLTIEVKMEATRTELSKVNQVDFIYIAQNCRMRHPSGLCGATHKPRVL